VRLVQEAYVDAVLAEEIICFQLPAANTVGVPISQWKGFCPVALLGRAVILSCKKRITVLGQLFGELCRLGGKRPL
jgi:hypothetical protein